MVMPRRMSNQGIKTDSRLALLPPCDPNLSIEGRLAFVKQFHRSQRDKPSSEQILIAKLVTHYDVSKSTLQDRINGALPKNESNAARRLFTPAESNKLIELICTTAEQGFPLTKRRLKELVNHLLLAKHVGVPVSDNAMEAAQSLPSPSSEAAMTAPRVGFSWADRWLAKHGDQVCKYSARALDQTRANAVNPENIKHWYELLGSVLDREKFDPDLIFGMDETCGWGDTSERQQVLGGTGKKTQASQHAINRESTTLIVTVSASGEALRPYVIFKGVKAKPSWSQVNPLNAKVTALPNAYTSDVIAVDWLDFFHKQVQEHADGRPILLLLDGHCSHHTLEFLQRARSLGIICLGYPPHTTHVLQCLDVVGFSQFKRAWAALLFARGRMTAVKKDNYLGLIEAPYLHAFTADNIKAGFRKTGVAPFNPSVVTPLMMAPSIPNSGKALFPLPQTSPVRALAPFIKLAEWNPPFVLEPPSSASSTVSPGSSQNVQDISIAFRALDISPDLETTPIQTQISLPMPRSPPGTPIGPSLHISSPPAAYRALDALRKTSTGSYLVNSGPIPEEIILPPPVLTLPTDVQWSLPLPSRSVIRMSREELKAENLKLRENLAIAMAHIKVQDEIIRGNNAQMTLQWLYVSKLDDERISVAKKTRQSVFPGGHGVELTGAPFMDASQARCDAKAAEDAAKLVRAKELAITRVLKASQDAAWKLETETITAAAEEWTRTYGGMSKSLLKALDAPNKPKRRLKKVVFDEAAALLMAEPEGVIVEALENVSLSEDFAPALEDVHSDGEESEYHPYAEG